MKGNALIEASHKLNEVEQRLILLAIIKARQVGDTVEQLMNKELEIHASDYMQAFNVDRTTAYRTLKASVIGLYGAEWGYRYVNNKGNLVVRYERFTQSAEYVENEATVKFMFSYAIIPYLVELEKCFTTYEIKQIANLKSRYSMRLYEFLVQFRSTGKLRITLEELRFRLGLLDSEYKTMGNTFGENTHKLTIAEMPIHNFNINFVTGDIGGNGKPATGSTSSAAANLETDSLGSDVPHNNIQPSIVTGYWLRTA